MLIHEFILVRNLLTQANSGLEIWDVKFQTIQTDTQQKHPQPQLAENSRCWHSPKSVDKYDVRLHL
jgi:hypothetical protein